MSPRKDVGVYVWCCRFGGYKDNFRVLRFPASERGLRVSEVVSLLEECLQSNGPQIAEWAPLRVIHVLLPNERGEYGSKVHNVSLMLDGLVRRRDWLPFGVSLGHLEMSNPLVVGTSLDVDYYSSVWTV